MQRFTNIWNRVDVLPLRLAACGVLALAAAAVAWEQGAAGREGRSLSGTIERFTTAPRGEIDGAVLDGGAVIHWPPHVGERMTAIVNKGDRVRVVGATETGPEGDRHFEVQSLTNTRTSDVVKVADVGPPAPPRRGGLPAGPAAGPGRNAGAMKTVRGTIDRFTTAPRGEVDGAVLNDGSVIHWPPHMASKFRALADEGDEVKATGRMETGPEGDAHLEVQTVTNVESNDTATNEDLAAAARPRGPGLERRGDRDQRLRALEQQLDEMRREIDRLRRER